MTVLTSSERLAHLVKGAAAFVVLTALIVAVPLVLALVMGWPLPHHVPPLAGLRTSRTTLGISDRALLDVVAWVAWVAWFNILLSTLGNIVALIRGSESPRIPIAGAFQPLTASLLGAVFLALLAFGRTPPATSSSARSALSVQIGSTTAVLTADSDMTQPVPTSGTSITSAPDASIPVVYTVVPEDSLWTIAQMKLGNALEWPEIFALNEGRLQPDGRALSDPSLIYPGWELVLPPAPSTRSVTTPQSGSPTPGSPATSVPIPITTPTTVSPTTVRSDQPPTTATSVPGAASSPARPVGGASEPGVTESQTNTSITLPSGSLIASSFAAGVLAALTLGRLRRRRRYEPRNPASGRDLSPSTLTPTLRTLVETRSERFRQDGGGPHDVQDRSATAVVRTELPDRNTVARIPSSPGVLEIGIRDGEAVWLDFANTGSLDLLGPCALDITRAWCAALLVAGERGSCEVLTTTSIAESLFPGLAHTTSVRATENAEALLRRIETEIIGRSRALVDADVPDSAAYREARPEDPLPFLLIVFDQLPEALGHRWRAMSELAQRVGIGAISFAGGEGMAAQITTDASRLVTSASPPQLEVQLRRATLFGIEGIEATELLNAVIAAQDESSDDTRDAPIDPAVARPSVDGVTDVWPEGDTIGVTHSTKPICVRLLGPYRIAARGEEITTGLRTAARELLAWYLLRPDGASIEAVVDALWPDTEPELVTKRFWRALGDLRSRLRDDATSDAVNLLIKSGNHYRPQVHEIECDLWVFEHQLGVAAQAENDDEVRAALRAAVTVYRGELVSDVEYLWVEAAREDLHLRALDARLRLAELEEARGRADAAVDELSHALEMDRFAEEVFRRLMALLSRLGRPDEITLVYKQLQRNLDELQLDPAPVTVRLYQELIRSATI